MRKSVAFALSVACLSVSLGALPLYAGEVTFKACAGSPSKGDEDAARGLFAAGRTAYEEADYAKAIQYWKDAFDRDCTAGLLLVNLANAYEKKGDTDAAISTLETYIKRNPKADDAPTIQKRIENMRKTKVVAPPPATSSAKPAATTTAPPPASTTMDVGSKGPGIGPFVVIGAGAVVTIVGGVLYLGGKSKISDSEAACPDRKCPVGSDAVSKGNDGRSQVTLGGVVAVVGLLGVAGGATWYALAPKKTQTAVTPVVAPGLAGVSVLGRF